MTTHAKMLSGLAIAVAALATVALSANEASAKNSVARSIATLRAPLVKVTPASALQIQRRNFEIQGLMGRRSLRQQSPGGR
jgi:hypothetical protein